MTASKFSLLILVLLFGTATFAQVADVVVNDASEVQVIGTHIEVLVDTTAELTFKEAQSADGYAAALTDVPDLGVSANAFWIRFTVSNQSSNDRLLVQAAYPVLDELTLYRPNGTEYEEVVSGQQMPFADRDYNHQNFIFDLNLAPGASATYYMRVKSGEEIIMPLNVGSDMAILESNGVRDLISGIYYGLILVMILYNVFVYASTKDKSYLLYGIFTLFVGLVQAVFQGYSYRFLWPSFPAIAEKAIYLVGIGSGVFGLLFMHSFIQVRKYVPKLRKWMFVLFGMYAIVFALAMAGQYDGAFNLLNMTAMLVSLYMLFVGYRVARKGFRPARWFLLAQSIFLLGVVLFVMRNFGVLPFNLFTEYVLQIGSSIEVVLLSIALADRINILKKEKEVSQAEAYEALLENERIVREQNIILEQKVSERTVELQESNEELQVTLAHLKETQSQLVDAEKMASLGQLTAGIAHEINNPINFVTANIEPLRRDLDDLLEYMTLCETVSEETDVSAHITKAKELREELEVDFLKDEMSQLLDGIKEGANRTAEIVKGLRIFSRLDEGDKKQADINAGLKSTLTLLTTSLGSNITVDTDFGDLPEFECFPGKLNQLFMNVLTNSIQAVNSHKEREGNGKIELKTAQDGNHIVVQIKDNGVGMTEEVKHRIFEPFFTTKDVGEGTGLGLSIAYKIVEDHNGAIEVDSTPGEGTTFNLRLPMD